MRLSSRLLVTKQLIRRERGDMRRRERGRGRLGGGGGSVAMNTCLIEKAWLITKKSPPGVVGKLIQTSHFHPEFSKRL